MTEAQKTETAQTALATMAVDLDAASPLVVGDLVRLREAAADLDSQAAGQAEVPGTSGGPSPPCASGGGPPRRPGSGSDPCR